MTIVSNTRRSLLWFGLFLILFFAVLLICAPHADAAYVVDSGDCGADGDNVKWVLDSDGVLTISGEGEMMEFCVTEYNDADVTDAPWGGKNCIRIKKVVIQSGVTNIGECAFYDCRSLTSVTIPNSVTSIGCWAFSYCSSMKSVTIGNGVTSIGVGAFEETALYKNVSNWSNDVLYIGKHLIKAKQSISGAYSIKAGTRCIAEEAFFNCNSLTSVTIPNSVTSIGRWAFEDCFSLTSVTIGNSVTSIGDYAFHECEGLMSVTIPASVKSIGEGAFYYCSGLKSVTIPASVTNIGDDAFADCDATIYCYKNSFAQTYAKDNGLRFVVIECAHTYKKVVEKATMTTNGKCYNQCTICGAKGKKVRTIAKISTVKLSKTTYICTGKTRTPTPVVQDANGNNLKLNTDYRLNYSSGRKACGKYAVKVVFIGNYSGSKTLKFKIKPGQVTGLTQVSNDGLEPGERFKLIWNAVKGATQYEVFVKQNGKFKKAATKTGTEANNTSPDLNKGQKIEVMVRAVGVAKDGTEYFGTFSTVYIVTVR